MTGAILEASPNQSIDTSVVTLAASGLQQMLDPDHQLFCLTLRMGSKGLVREGVSPRYTMMTLLGLHRWLKSGRVFPAPLSPILDRLIAEGTWLNCMGDLGLLLWTCALLQPERLGEVAQKMCVHDALSRYQDGLERRTMELAWFLTGLCYGLQTEAKGLSALFAHLDRAFRLLIANQGPKAIFGHLARSHSLSGFVRGGIGSFADQVYPIYALAQFGRLTGNREALGCASACAETICELQGPLGEWWWHYDARTGKVVETYPVYSVHQDGMAPMALFALGDATKNDFTRPIQKGLAWIHGRNELAFDMRCEASKLIWRNLQLSQREQYLRRLLPSRQIGPTPSRILTVNRECRPYELGWALYALAGRAI